ncbi:MAG: acyl-CoA thioesterase [Akkermansiaceae bacterium]
MQLVYKRRVHFADTDAAGVVHFSRLLCYAEEAEHELLGKLAIPLLADGGWPRVHVECDYSAPASMGDDVEITISVEKLGKSSVSWIFSMSVRDRKVANGKFKTVRVDKAGNTVLIPEEWRNLLLS